MHRRVTTEYAWGKNRSRSKAIDHGIHGIHGKKNEKKIVVLNYFRVVRVFRGRIRFMVFPFYDSVVK